MLTISNPNNAGAIYYTLDGSDPLLPAGGVSPTALVYTGPITLNRTTEVKSRVQSGSAWSALEDASFVAGASTIKLTELNYDPPKPPAGSLNNNDDFEFVELKNFGSQPVNLAGVAFTDRINYTFGSVTLAAGQVGVLVKNQPAFVSRYGNGPLILGNYLSTGQSFSNTGEHVALVDATGQTLADFTYSPIWYPSTKGNGTSLEVISPAAVPASDLNLATSWRASAITNGTPGVDDSIPTAAPTGVVATGSPGQVALTWNSVPGATTYSVYRGLTPSGESASPIISGLTTTTYNDAGRTNGQTYYYFITASDFGGESAHSAEAWATVGTPLNLSGGLITLKVETDAQHLDATVDGATTAYVLAQIGTITVNGASAGTTLTIDQTGANSVPSVRYVGGSGVNTLVVLGTAVSDTVALTDTTLTFGASVTTLTNIASVNYTDNGGNDNVWVLGVLAMTLNLGAGNDTLNVAAGSNATVNFGASSGDLTINGAGNTLLVIGSGNPNVSSNAALDVSAGPPHPTGIIRGRVFNDANGNTKRDRNEKGLAGRRVFLDLNNNGKRDASEQMVATAADGSYQFEGLASGKYTVREILPSGWRATTAGAFKLSLKSGQTLSGKDFGQRHK